MRYNIALVPSKWLIIKLFLESNALQYCVSLFKSD